MKDSELLSQFRQHGDRCALTQLLIKYEKLVWSVCRRSLNQVADAEDAFQTTFLIMVEKADRIRKPDSMGSWLYGVARKTASRIRRKRSRLVAIDASHLDSIIDEATSFDSITRQQLIDRVDQQIQSMPTALRTPLVLKYFGGFTAQEIADQMHLSVSAVEGRLRRAKAGLRDQMPDLDSRHGKISLAPGITAAVTSCQLRIDSVAEQCATMFSGSSRILQIVNLGNKVMIAKSFCVTAASVLLLGATVLHMGESRTTAAKTPLEIIVNPDQFDSAPQIQLAEEEAESASNESKELLGVHVASLHRLHDGVAQHAIEVLKWLHP